MIVIDMAFIIVMYAFNILPRKRSCHFGFVKSRPHVLPVVYFCCTIFGLAAFIICSQIFGYKSFEAAHINSNIWLTLWHVLQSSVLAGCTSTSLLFLLLRSYFAKTATYSARVESRWALLWTNGIFFFGAQMFFLPLLKALLVCAGLLSGSIVYLSQTSMYGSVIATLVTTIAMLPLAFDKWRQGMSKLNLTDKNFSFSLLDELTVPEIIVLLEDSKILGKYNKADLISRYLITRADGGV